MNKITTYNGITFGFDEISRNSNSEGLAHHLKVKGLDKHKIIGTTSTLTDEQVEPFVDDVKFGEDNEWRYFKNYTAKCRDFRDIVESSFKLPLESWNSLLEANNIDITKEYVILKLNK